MIQRIFKSIFAAALIAVILVTAFIIIILYNTYESETKEALRSEAAYIVSALAGAPDEHVALQGHFSTNRLTLIAPSGTVLYDNTVQATTLENHAGRSEVVAAFEKGTGESWRYSTTLSERTLYFAQKTSAGNVLRISRTQSSALGLLFRTLPAFIFTIMAVALLSLAFAWLLSQRIVAPINSLNLDHPLENDTYDELSPLLLRIQRQHDALEQSMLEITRKQREFTAVSENMREGLVLLSSKGNILTINRSAARIFGVDAQNAAGKHILSLNRSEALYSVVQSAEEGSSADALLKIGARHYQVFGNPVHTKDGPKGSVIVLMDVTDSQSAERSRREFTANVSHELKTPLTSISGYAEIMKNGLVRPEDIQGFAGRIYDEANRLIAQIEDILRLSQLDERENLPQRESVDLFALAKEVLQRLQPLALPNEITLEAQGEPIFVHGYRKLLDDMLTNLCENAIKYNLPKGSVHVHVNYDDAHKPTLSVEDTGIGIPKEHHDRVFERFYRLDKSHSRQTGGTGLGLSIVKHVAAMHGASIRLESEADAGTCITITFPKAK